jgi:hypothetical protein
VERPGIRVALRGVDVHQRQFRATVDRGLQDATTGEMERVVTAPSLEGVFA